MWGTHPCGEQLKLRGATPDRVRANRILYHSTVGSKVIKKRRRRRGGKLARGCTTSRSGPWFKNNYLSETKKGSEEGSYLRLMVHTCGGVRVIKEGRRRRGREHTRGRTTSRSGPRRAGGAPSLSYICHIRSHSDRLICAY